MKPVTRLEAVAIFALFLICTVYAAAQAKESATPSGGQAATGVAVADKDSAPVPDPIEQATRIQALGQAAWLQVKPGYLHLGPLYMSGASFSQMFDTYGEGDNKQSRTSSMLTANVFFTKQIFRYSRIAFQYAPNIYVIDGRVKPDFTHQQFSVGSAIPLSRKLTLNLSDDFTYAGQLGRYDAGCRLRSSFRESPSGKLLAGA